MSKTLQIFSHGSVLGAKSDIDNGTFINDIHADGQMGVVIALNEISITADAKDLLMQCDRDGGSFAPIMITRHEGEGVDAHGKGSIGMMGFGCHLFDTTEPLLSRDCDVTLLDDVEVDNDIEIPQGFIDAAEKI